MFIGALDKQSSALPLSEALQKQTTKKPLKGSHDALWVAPHARSI